MRQRSGAGLVVLKEAPCFSDQRPEADGNFLVGDERIEVLGWGMRPEETAGTTFLASHASVVGVFDGSDDDFLVALKEYQAARAAWKPGRDAVVLANPWGEGNLYQLMGEPFVAAELGATHYQLDDGWESGTLVELDRRHGINRVKIDGMQLRTKEAEDNLERLLRRVRDGTGGEVAFDLDVTADARSGYFHFQEYGNVFLENRYTLPHAPNYRPWLTLKNLGDLSPFIHTGRLEIEVLNLDNGRDAYAADDELAPRAYTQEYATAVTLFASPLLWFAPSRMRPETRARVRSPIDLHRRHREGIHAGHVLPVGERPSGKSWTALQSHDPRTGTGYLVVHRERTSEPAARLTLHFVEGAPLSLESLSDATPPAAARVSDGSVEVRLEEPNSFRLYRYRTG